MAIGLRARVRQLVLVNRNRSRAKGVATDMRYGVPLSSPIASRTATTTILRARLS